ncbi:MAG: PLP-dependent transferase [Clostridia bacterium]|nr:PLP-dependent transferase [Clostridia bacterium]
MDKPICEFLEKYNNKNPIRLHVPGHKGKSFLGYERYDLTEIDGADELYMPTGIIRKSQENASKVFGFPTFYSVEGSSHAIRSMLYLTKIYAKITGKKYKVLSTRNVHKSFLSACALLNAEVEWLYSDNVLSYFSNYLTAKSLEEYLKSSGEMPCALYVTSPDYLGNLLDIEGIAKVAKKYGVLLLVDNAHGAYLNFLGMHPITLGATMCADSAHKTLPVLTGGAYLHLSNEVYNKLSSYVESALSLFGTTSPSYLILSSLDNANDYLENEYKSKLNAFIYKINGLKSVLNSRGYTLVGNEPLKLTINAKNYGFTGQEIANILKENGIYVEFYDIDYVVLMFTIEILDSELEKVKKVLLNIKQRTKLQGTKLAPFKPERALTLQDTLSSLTEIISVENAVGRVYADFNLPCPPAVPIIMPGEVISQNTQQVFKYYNINEIKVIK